LKSDYIVNQDKKKSIKYTLFKLPVKGFCCKQFMVAIDLCIHLLQWNNSQTNMFPQQISA